MDTLGVGITIGTGTSDFQVVKKHLELAETQDLEFVEFSIFDLNIISGRKIIQTEIKKLQSICNGRKIKYTVHGELSVNFFDIENIDYHKDVLKRDIEISSAIGALHLVTHFGSTTENIFNNQSEYKNLLKIQREFYEEMGEYAKSHNVIVAVENLFSFYKNHYAPLPSTVAEEIKIINHPNIKGTLDFSHAYLNCNHRGVDFMKEINAMSPISKHLHVHDSFGILNNLWRYNDSEMLSYGIGDLHLPIGWGTIPFDDIFDKLNFPDGLILNLEIQERFIDYFIETIRKARLLLNKAKIIK